MDGYVLTVGGQEVGVAASEADLQALLDRVAEPYITEDTVDYGFVEDVSITSRQISSDTAFDLEALYSALTANSVEEAVYVVEKGDAFSRIAKSLGMTVSELSELNPDVVIDKIWVGQELVIQKSVPFLSVYTVNNETYEKAIESPVEYTDTDSMYQGDTKVTEQGEDGVARVTADVTYVNGYETERTVISTTTLQEATTTHILRGTKEKPRTASTGSYSWPCSGTITSRYGYRSHRSGYCSALWHRYQGRRRRHRHLRRTAGRIRQPSYHYPRQRFSDLLRPQLLPGGIRGRQGLQGADCGQGGLHRQLHRQPLPF